MSRAIKETAPASERGPFWCVCATRSVLLLCLRLVPTIGYFLQRQL
jgi:hypothetical protein